MRNYQRGETVILTLEVRNRSGTLVNSGSVPTITVRDAAGTLIVDNQAMTNVSTGQYEYTHNIGVAVATGWWPVTASAVDASKTTIAQWGFEVFE